MGLRLDVVQKVERIGARFWALCGLRPLLGPEIPYHRGARLRSWTGLPRDDGGFDLQCGQSGVVFLGEEDREGGGDGHGLPVDEEVAEVVLPASLRSRDVGTAYRVAADL